ncbi:hypothetical protein [Paracandidimonas lactea]|uniref:hypothetical protein n=1 Tax=Paracandidimonas lactea TaxID=2895524 RepID=UPI001F1B31B9|nr:hypothetical protein [Paracandidimonas lactea]
MALEHIGILIFFFVAMGVGALAVFFSSDYAQKRWNPEKKACEDDSPKMVIESGYRTRQR